MKFILFILFCFPVYACKMTPEGYMRRSEDAAKKAVTEKTKRTDLLAKHVYPFWYVRTTKPTCVEYKVGIKGGDGSCKMTGKILAEMNCQ